MSKKDSIIKTPQIDFGRFGVNANGGCAVGFNTNQGAWEYQTQNFQFYLADYDQPVGAYWGASHRNQTPQGGRLGRLFGRGVSQVHGWDKLHSLQTSYPPQTAQHVIAQSGDTLESIAEQYYGSADGATLIAMNNGFMLGGGSHVVTGQNIDLPEYTPLTNNASNAIAYWQFMDIMSARLNPYVQIQPEISPLEIFISIVAVVVAIAVAPELSAHILGVTVAALTTVADMVLVSAVAAATAALIDAAGQGILIGGGLEQQFSPGEVFDAALSAAAGIKGGITGGIHIGSNAVVSAILRAGIVNVGAQLAELAAGRITQIQLSQIILSMGEAGLGEAISPDVESSQLSVSQAAKTAAQSVMNGYIEGAISGRPVNLQNIFTDLLESEGEDAANAMDAGRAAIAQADQKQATNPATGKIPAPQDTATGWKRAGKAGVSSPSSSAANDHSLGSYADESAYASMDQHLANNNSVNRWGDAGSAAVNQQTRAAHFMSNQIQQAAAKSDELNFTPDDAYKIFLAQQAVSAGFLQQNANNSAWESAGRSSVNSNAGFWNRAVNDAEELFQSILRHQEIQSYAHIEAGTGQQLLDLNTLSPQERLKYSYYVDETRASDLALRATAAAGASMFLGPEIIGASVPELFPAVSSMGYYLSADGVAAMAAPAGASLFAMRAGLNGASDVGRSTGLLENVATDVGSQTTTNPLAALLQYAKPTPGTVNQLETTLGDGTKIIFRRDVGEHAHPIGKAYKEPVDHYNIEIHSPNPAKPGKFIREENVHIILDETLNPVDVFLKNNERIIDSLVNNTM